MTPLLLSRYFGISEDAGRVLAHLLGLGGAHAGRLELAAALGLKPRATAKAIREIRQAMEPRSVSYRCTTDTWWLTFAGVSECEDALHDNQRLAA